MLGNTAPTMHLSRESSLDAETPDATKRVADRHQPRSHLVWMLGVVAALLLAAIEVALIAMPEAGPTTRRESAARAASDR